MDSQRLKQIYDERYNRTKSRFPGTVVAGRANYPTTQHEKAWRLVQKAYESWKIQEEKEFRIERHRHATETKRNYYDQFSDEVVKDLAAGDTVEIRWTNSGRQYTAIAQVVRINAATVKIQLVAELPNGYVCGQSWALPKFGTPGNGISRKIT